MSTLTESGTGGARTARLERVRMASFGALTMLILQFVLGSAYSLYGTAPTAKKSVGTFSSPLLGIHAVLGILLFIAAAVLVFRAVQAKAAPVLISCVVGLVAIVVAGLFGGSFAQDGSNGASLGMAIGTAVAMLCYAANLVITGKRG